jgi:hypothetical protein
MRCFHLNRWQRIGNQINAAPIPEKFNAFLSRVA